MDNISDFIIDGIKGVFGNATYDGLKAILGDSFNKLKSYISSGKNNELDKELKKILEDNDFINQIEGLMPKKIVKDSFKELEKTKIDLSLGENIEIKNSFKNIKKSTIKIN